MTPRHSVASWFVPALIIAGLSCALAGLSSRHLERLWDEQVDYDIAVGLRDHPLTGETPAIDASQTRLPMYVTAMAFAITGRSDLAICRAISLVFAGITIIAACGLGSMLFGPTAGILAAILLGLSPYFLSFARIAMTEGDIFFACFCTLSIWAFVVYLREPSPSRWLTAGVMLALAIGAKFFAIFLFVVFLVLATSTGRSRFAGPLSRYAQTKRVFTLLIAGLLVIGITIGLVHFARGSQGWARHAGQIAVGGWIVEWILCLAVGMRVAKGGTLPAGAVRSCLAMYAFAVMVCCTIMPVHMTEPDIAVELARRTLHWDHRLPLALWSDHLRLYAGIVLTKATVPIGILTATALIFAAFREREDGRWRPCILPVIFYVVMLCFLPLRQTFYLMGVYPLIMIVTAGSIMEVSRRLRRRRGLMYAWGLLVVFLFAHLGWRVFRGFPYYHIYAYDNVGDRWMGKESRGYRNLIQTPSDGVEELIHWCDSNALVKPGARIVSFLWEERIIETLLPADRKYMFISRGLSQESDMLPLPPSIDKADFVLLHLNNILGYGDRLPDTPPMDVLAREFKVVHTIMRGPLAVGWVYGRENPSTARTTTLQP